MKVNQGHLHQDIQDMRADLRAQRERRLKDQIDIDTDYVRIGHAAHNMAIVRQMTLNTSKKGTSKGSARIQRFKAGPNTSFLEQRQTMFDAIAPPSRP